MGKSKLTDQEISSHQCSYKFLLRHSKNILITIQPYILSSYSIKYTFDFIQILKSIPTNKFIMTSLDAENHFINVPVQEIITIIIENVYNHPSIPPPAIKPNILEKYLHAC